VYISEELKMDMPVVLITGALTGIGRKASLAVGVPPGRVARPHDMARVILLLASEGASFVTGQIVTVNGGKTAG
jgi:NAD(P)-dependent dehydrogenase (short-subunit alcohol dehydrogenase family)